MSSTEQAFVKAFARRKRAADDSYPPPGAEARPAEEPSARQSDRGVAGSANVWLDPIADQIARADQPDLEIPRSHMEPPDAGSQTGQPPRPAAPQPKRQSEPTEPLAASLQHIHTAYAAAAAFTLPDAAIASTASPDTPNVAALAVQSYSTTEWQTGQRSEAVPTAKEQPAAKEQPKSTTQPVVETIQSRVDPPQLALEGPHLIKPFQAVWEVDVFDIPTTVADLFFGGELFQQISERMSDAVTDGLKTMLITSARAGEGRSSVAIGMAMAAAAAGVRVALVDADLASPTLADDLRLDLQHGWVDTIRSGLPIKEVAVHAIEDGVTLIPLMPPSGSQVATVAETVQLIELLKDKFELVIVDGPDGASIALENFGSAVDSAIIVCDASRTDPMTIAGLSRRLRQSGVQGIGIVENFAPSDAEVS